MNPLDNPSIVLGKRLILDCNVVGTPTPTLQWTKVYVLSNTSITRVDLNANVVVQSTNNHTDSKVERLKCVVRFG